MADITESQEVESEEPDFSFPFESEEEEEEPVACPECGMEFEKEHGKNIHVGQAHDQ